ncbi:RagB/SusD family nutrient uptake outer membrane protein [Paraflavitalea sp. CAU 1676]|uniref:RagB/SusD family nutrient uptake outer membrane protein n=1 Tax=Paraflavitalea sp. CAU 1676 TaxID=3032598 RepID=UPI0023DA4360|nr:RagB/SusD family nutrient uptake outer membrane protein [Paraflavitalea sp. CAU 1676]MDF2187137.1 RagB/SusD family nutrient uptake outer membrane protein [Paraflavitalea sp. CAU 1676]
MKLKKYIWFAALAVMAASCKKQLDINPPDDIREELALTNVPDLEKAMIGVYAAINGTYDLDIYANSLYSDEAYLPLENNTGRGVIAYRWQTDPGISEVTDAWNGYAIGVDRANRIIAAADKLAGKTSTEEAQRKRIKGEAIGVRAYCEFQVLINYAANLEPGSLGVPYVYESKIQKPKRLTVGEVFVNLNKDLTDALALMPANFGDRTRLTLVGLYALRARVALYQKNWDLAISAATTVINAVPLATPAQYPLIWTDETNSEVIWKHKRIPQDSRIGDIYYDRAQNKIMYGASYELRSLFSIDDIRYESTVLELGGGRFAVGKYWGGDANEPGRADIKVFRTAEMYLIRAEAYAEKNQVLSGAADLNMLRSRRINGYTNEAFGSKESLISAVLTERYKELAFEAQRMHDLRRKLQPVTRLPEDAENALGAVLLNVSDKKYYYPIPASEILANENMEQNPTYK